MTDADRMRAAVARLAEASAGLAELLLSPSDAHKVSGAAMSLSAPSGARTAPGAAAREAPSIASGQLVAGAGAVSAPEAPSKNTREVVFSAPSQRPRVLGLDEAEASLLLANVLAVLEHARSHVHSSRRAQIDGISNQIRTALQRPKRGTAPNHGPPDAVPSAAAA